MSTVLDLLKAASHKYIRRIPKGRDKRTGRMRYDYVYKEHHRGGILSAVEDVEAGAAFKLPDPKSGQDGHFHVEAVKGDKITVKHDETERSVTMTKAEFKALLQREHGQALKETAKKRRETYERMKRESPKSIGLKAAKNRAEQLERMAGVDKVEEPEEDPEKKIKRLKTFIEYANKVQHFILDNKAMDHRGAKRALDLISERYLSDDFRNIFTYDQVLAMRPPAQKIDLGKIIKDSEKKLIQTENKLKAAKKKEAKSADNFETMPESKELSKKEKVLANQIEASAKKNLDFLQRIIKTNRRESNEYRFNKALKAATERIFYEVAKTVGLDEDYLYFAKRTPSFLHIDKSQNADFFNSIYAIYNGDTNAENENLEVYHKIIEKLVDHTAMNRSGGGVTAEERRNFKKLSRRFKAQEDLISKKLLKPKKEAKSKENFETMPESKEPAQEPKVPSKAQLTDLLSQMSDILKAKPELRNDPRIVGLFGTESKPTVNTDKRNSEIMITLDGKPQKGKVKYRIVEAGDAIASHEPIGFGRREDYPEGIQERKYHSDKAEMMKVIRNAQQFDPAYLINTNPDATNGPPVMTPEGIVLGGNSRVMSTQRVYANHPESAEQYKEFLKKQADTFGFDPNEVSKFKAPLLVREYEPKKDTKDHLAKLVRTLNETKTQGIDERQLGLATAVKIRDGRTLGALKTSLAESSFNNVENLMTKPSPALDRFKEALFADGVLTNENMNEMLRQADGTFTGRGRDFIKSMLVGYVVRDSDLLEGLSTSTINHLSTAISKLSSAGINDHAQKALQDAIEVYHHAVARDRLKRGMTPQARNENINDIMLSERELFNTEPKDGETEEQKAQREKQARFAKTKERVSKDPLASSFLKILTLSVGTRKLSEQMDKFLKLTEDTGVIDMFGGSSRVSFDDAARKLSKDLARDFGIEDQLYEIKKSLALLNFYKGFLDASLRR